MSQRSVDRLSFLGEYVLLRYSAYFLDRSFPAHKFADRVLAKRSHPVVDGPSLDGAGFGATDDQLTHRLVYPKQLEDPSAATIAGAGTYLAPAASLDKRPLQ